MSCCHSPGSVTGFICFANTNMTWLHWQVAHVLLTEHLWLFTCWQIRLYFIFFRFELFNEHITGTLWCWNFSQADFEDVQMAFYVTTQIELQVNYNRQPENFVFITPTGIALLVPVIREHVYKKYPRWSRKKRRTCNNLRGWIIYTEQVFSWNSVKRQRGPFLLYINVSFLKIFFYHP